MCATVTIRDHMPTTPASCAAAGMVHMGESPKGSTARTIAKFIRVLLLFAVAAYSTMSVIGKKAE
jgi:hypothetical protein